MTAFIPGKNRLQKVIWLLILGSLGMSLLSLTWAQERTPVTKANYKLAERFSPAKMKKMVFSTTVSPHWLKRTTRFWYEYETSEGKRYYLVDPAKRSKKELFDPVKLAAELTKIVKDPFDAQHLPLKNLKFTEDETKIRFEVESSQEEEIKEEIEEEREEEQQEQREEKIPPSKKKKKKIFYFEYNLVTGKLIHLKDYQRPPERPKWASLSPDGRWVVFARHHNLYLMDKENYQKYLKNPKDKTIEEIQLTTDGEEYYSYARRERGVSDQEREKNKDKRQPVNIIWAKDSSKLAMIRSDERKVKDLWVINSLSKPRPTLETYKYSMPGEENLPQREILIFDVLQRKKVKVKAEKFKDQYLSIQRARRLASSRDDEYVPSLWVSETSDKLYFTRTSRDLHRVDLCVADTETGEVKVLIEERMNTYIDLQPLELIDNGSEMIWWSERDGWGHYYLYNENGKLKRQLTSGPFSCRGIVGVDEKNRTLYFTACGREKGEDPYYLHLYCLNLDGGPVRLLNPGDFNHQVSMDDSQLFFVDNFSRVDTVPESVVRDNQGRLVFKLEKADLSLLFAAGYKFPERFKVKAADGITDLYGVMYKPFDLDKSKLYPLIAYVYPGPQTESVPKSFSVRRGNAALAQFGFIVICVGNRGGSPMRSKWYHTFGYGNLRDYGLADKKVAIEELATLYPFIDLERVGIYGHSGGGFMTAAALLNYPDFFKVGVASSGNHENNIYNNWWSEKHHGVKEVKDEEGNIRFEYKIDKNSELAKNLKGRLLLVTGDMDNNVHPANTLRLAYALIKAHKRFDMFILPGQRHGYGDLSDYWFWIRADYFCRHLIGDWDDRVDIIQLRKEEEQDKKK